MHAPHSVASKIQIKTLTLLVTLAFPALGTPSLARADDVAAEAVLPAITVSGQGLGAQTEGTGSYATGSTSTATPLGTSLRDTPQSVTVITQQRIEDQNLLTVTDVLNNATGVSVNQYETHRAQFTARGFDINTLMIDGVPTTWEQAWSSGELMTSLSIFDRVEIVRGSTGLTTGAGDPSAAINLVRKRATARELAGSVELGAGRWDEWRAMADLSTPVNQSGTVRARFVGELIDKDAWVDLLGNKSRTLFAAFEADLTPDTLLSGGVTRMDNKARGAMWGGLPVWYSNGSRTNWDRSKTTAADWVRWNSDYTNYFAAIEHRFGNDWHAKASYNHGDRESDSYLLYLLGAPDPVTGLGMFTWPGSYLVNTRQEDIGLQVNGPFEFMGRTHELAFGYVYSHQKFNADSRAAAGGAAPDFNNWNGSYPEPAWGPLAFYESSRTTQQALYGAARLRVADPLQLILGARLTNYRKSGSVVGANPYAMRYDDEFTPYAGLVYDINETYSAYASYTDIFRPQRERDIEGRHLEPVKGKAAEVGVKGEFFNGRLNASAALFRIRQNNLAQGTGVNIPGAALPETAYRAAEGATSEGIEFDLAGELAPGWNASLGVTKFRAKDALGVDVNSHYPRAMLRAFTTYRLPGDWNALTLGAGVNWQGKTHTDAENPLGVIERIEQDSVALVNLMARYAINRQLTAQLNINNVFDEKHFNMFDAFSQLTYAAPRNVMLTMNYRF